MKIIYYILFILIVFFPKINLITVSGTNTGIRIEDFVIMMAVYIYI